MTMAEDPRAGVGRAAAIALAIVLLVVAALVFFGLYLLLPQPNHFYALIAIGAVSLVFALAAYLGQSVTREPVGQRALAWGFLGMGFTILIGTVAFGPNANVTPVDRVVGLLVLFVVLAIVLVGVIWRSDAITAEARRRRAREAWERRRPVSAFEYAAAHEGGAGAPVLASPLGPTTSEPAHQPPPVSPPPAGGM
jgi:hypothetical protein